MTDRDSPETLGRRRVLQTAGTLAGAGVLGVLGAGTAATEGGDEVWQFQTGGQVRSSPTVADGTVLVGSGDDNVYALDAADGSQRWEFQTGNFVETHTDLILGCKSTYDDR